MTAQNLFNAFTGIDNAFLDTSRLKDTDAGRRLHKLVLSIMCDFVRDQNPENERISKIGVDWLELRIKEIEDKQETAEAKKEQKRQRRAAAAT